MIRDKEIIGLRQITLYNNKGVLFDRPNISVENEVDLIAVNDGNYQISKASAQIKWQRELSYSGNYKQIYKDEFTFFINGIEGETPQIVNELRANRNGYIVDISTINGEKYVFPAPIFVNNENTKEINSHTWRISLGYRVPTFENRLYRLSVTSTFEPQLIDCVVEIAGVRRMALYINDDVRVNRPDPSIENEVDLIAHGTGSFVIDQVNELTRWKRQIEYSKNYKPIFKDTFTFLLHGLETNAPEILETLRNNRLGYIVEIITTGGKSFVFPAPVFMDEDNTKEVNSNSWQVSMSYRVPTFEDKLIKLNTTLMTSSYILIGNNGVMAVGSNIAAISK